MPCPSQQCNLSYFNKPCATSTVSNASLRCIGLSCVIEVCDFQLHSHSNMIRSGSTCWEGWYTTIKLAGHPWQVAVIYCLDVYSLVDRSATRVGGEIAGKQHAPTAGIREVWSTVSGDRDAFALPEGQYMKLMLLSRWRKY